MVSDLRDHSNKVVTDKMISQLTSIITAGQVDEMRFNQAEIMLYLLDKLSAINDRRQLQPVTSKITYEELY